MKLEKAKGITLISLVVTIIILLILAGVSLSLVVGEDGIISRAVNAKKLMEEAQVKEIIGLAYQSAYIGMNYTGEKVSISEIENDLKKQYGDGVTVTDNGDDTYDVDIPGKGTYEINENGNITKLGHSIVIENMKVVNASGTEITGKISQDSTDDVYISFTATLENGTIINVTSTQGTPELNEGVWRMKVTENGTYGFTVTGIIDGETITLSPSKIVACFSSLPAGLVVGSVVTYYPAGNTYKWQGKYATTSEITTTGGVDKTVDDVELNSNVSGNDRITRWRVLDIDEEENVKIVPANHPTTVVKLYGANGYNNAIYLLNEACKTLYANSDVGVSANNVRSINVDDILTALTDTAISDAEGSFARVSEPYTTYKYYPLIYAREKKGIINSNDNSGSSLFKESEQTSKIERGDSTNELQITGSDPTSILKTATDGYVQATTNIQPYRNSFDVTIDLRTAKSSSHFEVLCPRTTDYNNYWVASRSVFTYPSNCWFGVQGVYGMRSYYGTCRVDHITLFDSGNFSVAEVSRAIFPLVSLSASLLESDGDTGFRLISQRNVTE